MSDNSNSSSISGLFLFKFTDLIFVILVCVNTLLSIDGIGAVFTQDEMDYEESITNRQEGKQIHFTTQTILEDDLQNGVGNYRSLGGPSGSFVECDYSDSLPKVLGKCPHRTLPIIITLMAVFGTFYLFVAAVRQYFCSKYAADDFRFYFYIDQWNNGLVSRILFGIGTLLTLAVTIFGFIEAAKYELGIGAVWNVFMFFLLNVKGLFFRADYCKNFDFSVWENVFTKPIPMTKLPHGEGFLHAAGLAFARKNFFLACEAAMTDEICGRGGLSQITSKPKELLNMMVLLSLEDEAKVKEFMEKRKTDAKTEEKEMEEKKE